MHISRAALMFCQFLLPVMKKQEKKGHYVCACASDDPEVQAIRQAGFDVFIHGQKRTLNPFNVIKAIIRTKKILVEQRINVLICHTPLGACVGRIAAKLAKTSHVIYFTHGMPCSPAQNPVIWFIWFVIEKFMGFFTDAIIVMNSYDEKLCKRYHIVKTEKVYRIPGMGVDLEKFNINTVEGERQQILQELDIPPEAKIILCVAYLIKEKGIFIFQKTCQEIKDLHDDVYFLLAGMGPCMNKLKFYSSRYGLEKHFKILGWRNDINKIMRISDVFVLPTYYFEGIPVSILEAMACYKPVIATDHRGCEDIVQNKKTGFLIPIKQVGPLVEKITQLVNDPQLSAKMGKAGREHIEQHFELNYCTEKIVETLNKVIAIDRKQ